MVYTTAGAAVVGECAEREEERCSTEREEGIGSGSEWTLVQVRSKPEPGREERMGRRRWVPVSEIRAQMRRTLQLAVVRMGCTLAAAEIGVGVVIVGRHSSVVEGACRTRMVVGWE